MNRYQARKAKLIAATMVLAAAQSTDVPMAQLSFLASIMSESEWRTVSFAAGVAVADRRGGIAQAIRSERAPHRNRHRMRGRIV